MGKALDSVLGKKPAGQRAPRKRSPAKPREVKEAKADKLPQGVNPNNLPGPEPGELTPAVGNGSTNPLQGRPY